MAVKTGEKRGSYKKRVDAKLPTYVDMSHMLHMEYVPAEWECVMCNSNSLLAVEYGCRDCQPALNRSKNPKLRGRKYKNNEATTV